MTNHILVPDTQVTPGVPIDHLGWIGHYIVDEFARKTEPLQVIHIGDHWDMHSLSSYDKGTLRSEGARYEDDIESGNLGFEKLSKPIEAERRKARKGLHPWDIKLDFFFGNHEERVVRAYESNPEFFGKLDLSDMDTRGWTTHDFLVPVLIDGIMYSHYFLNPANGRPVSGMMPTRLKTIGTSFTQGHQQGLVTGMYESMAGRRRGIVAGSCYLHDEKYRGPQAAGEWRGILVCWQVEDGDYDLMEVSLDYLCRRYEGVPLVEFLGRRVQ